MSIGERIKGARIMAQLSQRDLANAAGVSAMAISKYERDMDIPSSSVLIRLAKALGIKIEYFFRPTTITLSSPINRGQVLLIREQAASILEHVQDWLERYVDVESLLDKSSYFKSPSKRGYETLDDMEEAAQDVRAEWRLGLDPIDDLVDIFEDRGIKVALVDGYTAFDALTLLANNEIPVIILQRDMPGDRQRFCLARELGHLILEIPDQIDVEKAIHRFARALLAPRPAVVFELGPKRHSISLYELHLLKHKYGLSMQAWIERAKDLEILSEKNATQLGKLFRQRNWYFEEPGDALPPEEPQRFKRLVMHAYCEELISQARATELLGIDLLQFLEGEVERHGGLPIEMCG